VSPTARPAVAADERPAPAPASPEVSPRPPATSGGIRIEDVLVGPRYERFSCPDATNRFSLKAHKVVNVCLRIEHRPQTDHLALVWERNGAFYGKTPLEVPGTRTNVRTRAHMKLGESRLGSWSVRVVSERDVTLAQTTFQVEP
jgi:hypothetical protein